MGGYVINTSSYTPQDIVAIEPCYGHQGGNATRIYTRHGKVYVDNRRLQTVLKGIVKYYDAGLAMLRENYRDYLGCSQAIPLPLAPQLVMVAVKTRTALNPKDGATGYVNLCDVREIVTVETQAGSESVKCRILLTGGHSLPCLYSTGTIEKRLKYGRLALERHCSVRYECSESTPLPQADQDGAILQGKLFRIVKLFYELLTNFDLPTRKLKF